MNNQSTSNDNHYWPLILIFIATLLFFAKPMFAQSTGPCIHCPSSSLSTGMNTLRPEVNDLPNAHCTAITKDGVQCKRQALDGDTKCWQHSDKTPRCNATTKNNTKCKIGVKKEGDKCHHHDSETNKRRADTSHKTKAT